MPSIKRPSSNWDRFLKDLDSAVEQPVRLDCIGGFVITQLYGLARTTMDLDVVELAPTVAATALTALAGRGGSLSKLHGLYLDRVGIAAIPENYEDRLTEMFPAAYKNLRLMGIDPYDLILSKLERNSQKDRDDARYLAASRSLDLELLQERYQSELRWQLGRPEREDLTLKLWLAAFQEDREAHQAP